MPEGSSPQRRSRSPAADGRYDPTWVRSVDLVTDDDKREWENSQASCDAKPSSSQSSKSPEITFGDSLPSSLAGAPEILSRGEIHVPATVSSRSALQELSTPTGQAATSTAPQVSRQSSQAAQMVDDFFNTVLDRVTDSNEPDTTSGQENIKHSHDELLHGRLERGIDMADDAGNAGTRRSAVDELNELFTINPMELENNFCQPLGAVDIFSEQAKVQTEAQQDSSSTAGSPGPSDWHPSTVKAADESDLTATTSGIFSHTQTDINTQLLMPMPMHPHEQQPRIILSPGVLATEGSVLSGPAKRVLSEPSPLPGDLLDICMSSQSQPRPPEAAEEAESTRKRKFDDGNENKAKRVGAIPHGTASSIAPSQSSRGRRVSSRVSSPVSQPIADKPPELKRRAAASKDGLSERLQARERGERKIRKI